VRHILGLYRGEPGARAFRRYLGENAVGEGVPAAVLDDATAAMRMRRVPQLSATDLAGNA
jgi:tRNA-dihydrouridine synthase A